MVNGTLDSKIPFFENMDFSIDFNNSSELIGILLIIILCILAYKLLQSIVLNFVERKRKKDLMHDSQKLKFFDLLFNLYNNLWKSLVDLRMIGEDMWNRPTEILIKKFQNSLRETKRKIYENALLLEKKEIQKLLKILGEFENYRVGKKKLIELKDYDFKRDLSIIFDNKETKEKYGSLLDELEDSFRDKIFFNFGQKKRKIKRKNKIMGIFSKKVSH